MKVETAYQCRAIQSLLLLLKARLVPVLQLSFRKKVLNLNLRVQITSKQLAILIFAPRIFQPTAGTAEGLVGLYHFFARIYYPELQLTLFATNSWNYAVLMEEWDVCLSERLQPDVRARIIGCKAWMKRFDFFFGLHFWERLYFHTDDRSKDLQGTKVAAVIFQRLANLTKETLTKIPTSDQSFDHFYANISRKSEGLPGEPTFPLKEIHFDQTGVCCWCTKLPPNCQRSL